jgi:hypothetical protein
MGHRLGELKQLAGQLFAGLKLNPQLAGAEIDAR